MIETLAASINRNEVVTRILNHLSDRGHKTAKEGSYKPWGFSIKVDDSELDLFLASYFRSTFFIELRKIDPKDISPRILIVQPHRQLSWQVHSRRSEWWHTMGGPVGALLSTTDVVPSNPRILQTGESIIVDQGIRHRLQGLNNWGVVAELWINSDSNNPTDKYDIRRVLDDFGRAD